MKILVCQMGKSVTFKWEHNRKIKRKIKALKFRSMIQHEQFERKRMEY